jgi:hypothetical protein
MAGREMNSELEGIRKETGIGLIEVLFEKLERLRK